MRFMHIIKCMKIWTQGYGLPGVTTNTQTTVLDKVEEGKTCFITSLTWCPCVTLQKPILTTVFHNCVIVRVSACVCDSGWGQNHYQNSNDFLRMLNRTLLCHISSPQLTVVSLLSNSNIILVTQRIFILYSKRLCEELVTMILLFM